MQNLVGISKGCWSSPALRCGVQSRKHADLHMKGLSDLHMKGLTEEWMCLCCLRPEEVAKVLPQSGQAWDLAPTCWERMCLCKLLGSVKTCWVKREIQGQSLHTHPIDSRNHIGVDLKWFWLDIKVVIRKYQNWLLYKSKQKRYCKQRLTSIGSCLWISSNWT